MGGGEGSGDVVNATHLCRFCFQSSDVQELFQTDELVEFVLDLFERDGRIVFLILKQFDTLVLQQQLVRKVL